MTRSTGTIIIPASETARYTRFYESLLQLRFPTGTSFGFSCGPSIPDNLNKGIRIMRGDWLWIMGDDHLFDPDILNRLLARELDVVVPLVAKRMPPFEPVIFSRLVDAERHVYKKYRYDQLPTSGLLEVPVAGTAGMLVRRPVLDAVGDPWFEARMAGPKWVGEDVLFCERIRGAGYKIHVDLDVTMGHLGNFAIWPRVENGEWAVKIEGVQPHDREGAIHQPLGKPSDS